MDAFCESDLECLESIGNTGYMPPHRTSDWRERFAHLFVTLSSENAIFEVLSREVKALEFEHCSYGVRLPLPVMTPQFVLLSNYPKKWQEQYVASNYFSIDPTVQHGLTHTSPMIWSATHQREHPAFWEEARHHGLETGWCVPARGQFGAIGLVSLVRTSDSISAAELDDKEARVRWLTASAHVAMSRILAPKLIPESSEALTQREREVLQWTSAGKTYGEIGLILSIDDRTVKFHISNSIRKLHASNKTEAAIKAISLGFL